MAASKSQRFWIGFSAGLVLAVILNLVPYLLTRGAYHGDGFEVIGFPFVFRSSGGFAYRLSFSWLALAADLFAAGIIALAAGYIGIKIRSRDSLPEGIREGE